MKKVMILLVLVFTLITMTVLLSCGGDSTSKVDIIINKDSYKPGEKDALIVLKAYADKDLKALKSYAAGAQKMVMKDEYFESNSNVNGFRKKISKSNGSFIEIRYNKDRINFQDVYYLTAVFYKDPSSGQVTAVKLRSKDKKKWGLSGFGTSYLSIDEFNKLSLEIPE